MKTRDAAASVCPFPPTPTRPIPPISRFVCNPSSSFHFLTLILTSSSLPLSRFAPWRARVDFERTVATAFLAVATQLSVTKPQALPWPTDLPLSSSFTLLPLAVVASLGSSKSELCPRTRSAPALPPPPLVSPFNRKPPTAHHSLPSSDPQQPSTQPFRAFYSPLLSLYNRVVKVLLATLTPLPSLH